MSILKKVGTGLFAGVIALVPASASSQDEAPQVAPLISPQCDTDNHRQFDFWLGEWNVKPAGEVKSSAVNKISATHNGCVVLEEYQAGNFTGMSISFYDEARGIWHQTWMANGGVALYLEGGLNKDGAMELSDKGLPVSAKSKQINRIIWTPEPDGTVRQLWEASKDKGESWNLVFDGIYTQREQ